MNWFTGSAIYLVLWFLVLLIVLPLGVKIAEQPEEGHATSAPIDPRIGLKILITTIVAAVLWFGVDYVVANNIIDFRAQESAPYP